MLKNTRINLMVMQKIATALGPMNGKVIYVGGAVVSLYITSAVNRFPKHLAV